ncbi:uncharacterized protein LOC119265416 [Pygocentrus nattereri]|uniref:uncharacterized protein LOC119265416 n=1 Tax=Pygocentrus nattereri TaxID=42514 RepID=UPI00189151E5|nr:uncharacterized protein LOC119265416 [Pygocentrus nattereri]
MRPLSVLLCAVTITCFCYCASSEDFTVTQTPSELTVKEGGSVSVACCWDKNITGVKVKWFKDDQLTGHWSDERLHTEVQGNCSVLSIKNIRNNETGLYICEVMRDVPKLDIRRGEGTAVNVQTENEAAAAEPKEGKSTGDLLNGPDKTESKDVNSPHSPSTEEDVVPVSLQDELIIYVIRCIPFITLLLVVCFLNRGTKKSPRPTPCSQNVPNAEEEERELEEGEEQMGEERERDGGNEQVQEETGLEERNEQMRRERELEEEDKVKGQKREKRKRGERQRKEQEE